MKFDNCDVLSSLLEENPDFIKNMLLENLDLKSKVNALEQKIQDFNIKEVQYQDTIRSMGELVAKLSGNKVPEVANIPTVWTTVPDNVKIVETSCTCNCHDEEELSAKTEDEVISEEEISPVAEPIAEEAPCREDEVKPRKKRKERGGSVFTDFETLTLDNVDYSGNSVIHSAKL